MKAVGDFTSTAAARVLDVFPVGPWAMALIWRESRGLLGGLVGEGVGISDPNNVVVRMLVCAEDATVPLEPAG